MNRHNLSISNPCSESFEVMQGEGAKRFCGSCKKSVHNLSMMTREEAVAVIRENAKTGLCVTYRFDHFDRILFRPAAAIGAAPRAQLQGVRRLLGAATLVGALIGLPACDPGIVEDPASVEVPCENPTQGGAPFRPIDDLMAAEARFMQELRDMLDDDVDVMRTAGEPMIVMGDFAGEPPVETVPLAQ